MDQPDFNIKWQNQNHLINFDFADDITMMTENVVIVVIICTGFAKKVTPFTLFEQFQHLLLLIHTVMGSMCPPCCRTTKACFCSVRCCTILLESPSVLTTLGSDIRQQSFTNNTFTVIRAAYFCSRFHENNASFAHTRDANRNHHVMHLTSVGNLNTKRVSLFGAHCIYRNYVLVKFWFTLYHCIYFFLFLLYLLFLMNKKDFQWWLMSPLPNYFGPWGLRGPDSYSCLRAFKGLNTNRPIGPHSFRSQMTA